MCFGKHLSHGVAKSLDFKSTAFKVLREFPEAASCTRLQLYANEGQLTWRPVSWNALWHYHNALHCCLWRKWMGNMEIIDQVHIQARFIGDSVIGIFSTCVLLKLNQWRWEHAEDEIREEGFLRSLGCYILALNLKLYPCLHGFDTLHFASWIISF